MSALRNFSHDRSSIAIFRAFLNDDEVTVSFTSKASSQEAIVTVHCANRRKLVWHDKLERCVAATRQWEWFVCLSQGSGRPGIHLSRLREGDVVGLPDSLRRDAGRAVFYCEGSGV